MTSSGPSSSSSQPTHVRVGVGVLIRDPKSPPTTPKVFAGIRKGSHGAGSLALPGGHLELYESWEECAAREVLEETGLYVHNLKVCHVTNDPMPDSNKHYVTIFMMGDCVDPLHAQPENLEPHKCQGWDSYSLDQLRSFLTSANRNNDDDDGNVNKEQQPYLFGPLKHLVEEAPQKFIDFMSGETK
mmetsp:Transcript_3757/g.6811  ORF Transcript_3757/g.6811 Transcript_3757/m.6811 type:complete len:186 (-) Transcript_3757:398-955(-)|eukprot:CAMPEP_0198296636 /NCGR_PEP_ID=MMETSP1449-20131203/33265_1 /TAXON_ID=420275 /ORGANISM="Attheya septentrionalis, Strain CCMP2084" /LENGTH=185 /DNA_ID=CAMNT_0043997301 /DNA_START=40 /DNA_END=597 /DNA_ORIENTATION=+